MKILLSPQFNDGKINYTFKKDIIIAELNGVTDIFDFTEMPDGKIENPEIDIESNFGIPLVLSAEKKDGVLSVELLNYIDFSNSTEEERFPEWFEVKFDGED